MPDFGPPRRHAAEITSRDAAAMATIFQSRLAPALADFYTRHAAKAPAWTLDALEAVMRSAAQRGTAKVLEPVVDRVLARFTQAAPAGDSPATADLIAASYIGIRICEIANMTPPALVSGELAHAREFCGEIIGVSARRQADAFVNELQLLALKSLFNPAAIGDALMGLFSGGATTTPLPTLFETQPPPEPAPQPAAEPQTAPIPAAAAEPPPPPPPPPPAADSDHDARVIGRWTNSEFYSSGGFTGSTSRTRVFLPDGRFVEKSSAAASLTHTSPDGHWEGFNDLQSAAPGERGTWTTAGKVLSLAWEDGSQARMQFMIDSGAMLTISGSSRKLWRRG